MAPNTPEALSYFELRKERLSSSGSHSPGSHLSHVSATPPLHHTRGKTRRPDLRQQDRSQSDSKVLRLSPYIPTIQEDIPSHDSTPVLTPLDEGVVSHTDVRSKRHRKHFSSSWSHEFRISSASHETVTDQGNDDRSASRSLGKTFIRPHVARSVSEYNIPSSPPELRQRSRSVGISTPPIAPLRPPMVTRKSASISEHLITVETPFPDSLESRLQDTAATPVQQPSKRRSSINPKHIFSVSVGVFRRRREKSSRNVTPETDNRSATSNALARFAKDHKSNLRRQQTTTVLVRVTSMLHDVKRPDLKGHTGSNNTIASAKPNKQHQYRKDIRGSPSPIRNVRPRDFNLEDTESQSSSLADLNLSHPPNNTPDEQAKYTVVNQYGELEEFLKVDISVRGQTSYLPSEARRIHTPPLPSEDRSGTRRGFFFDYNLPFSGQCNTRRRDELPDSPSFGHRTTSGSKRECVRSATAEALSRKRNTKLKTGDWYGTQLAKIDSVSDTDDQSPQERVSNAASLLSLEIEETRQHNEAQLDYNVPEHLPTSPLCPRHPRYWRVIKNKGSQFRGCWMHGFGDFSDLEKATYRIIDKSAA